MNAVSDPLFYPLAIVAVTALGLGKGGFAGVGIIATPLLATILPPLQAAAILLPILVVQDAISASCRATASSSTCRWCRRR